MLSYYQHDDGVGTTVVFNWPSDWWIPPFCPNNMDVIQLLTLSLKSEANAKASALSQIKGLLHKYQRKPDCMSAKNASL